MRTSSLALLLVAPVCLWSSSAHAADHAVRPASDCASDGDGTTWSCAASAKGAGARRGFPAPTTLVRGDTYFIADGSYGAISVSQDVKGSTWITIKKAVAAAHGPAAGWTASLGDGQATFGGITVRASEHGFDGGYVEIDGVTGTGTSGHGFVITSTDDESELFIVPYYYMGNGGHVTLRHAELYHQTYVPDRGAGSIKVGEGSGNFTFQHLYVHDIPCNGFTLEGLTDVLIESCTIVKNHSTAVWHGQGLQADGGTNFVIRNNWWQDITGTAYIAMLSGTAANWKVYNNVFYQTSAGAGIAHGPFSTNASDTTINTFRFFSNTIVGFKNGLSSRVYLPGTVTDAQIRNNLWYCSGAGCLAADTTVKAGITASHNWYSTAVSHNAEPNAAGNASDPFVGLTALNFRLAAGADPIDRGFALGAPYDSDMIGVLRPQGTAFDIGAFEYTTSVPKDSGPADQGVKKDVGLRTDGARPDGARPGDGAGRVDAPPRTDGAGARDSVRRDSKPSSPADGCSCSQASAPSPAGAVLLLLLVLSGLLLSWASARRS